MIYKDIVGRAKEKYTLKQAMESDQSEMIAIVGRRRVGKTFLIRNYFRSKIDFEIVGIQNGTLSEQLQNFTNTLQDYTASRKKIERPSNWIAAFRMLIKYLEKKKVKRKRVVFIDELPWIASARSGFMKALDNFWNSWANKNDIVLVICGSAASWMISNVVNNKGGLHNRITGLITLFPFTLRETEAFLKKKKLMLNRYQIIQIYMAIGGIPLYLDKLQAGKSAAENIDLLCFRKSGFLRDEFDKLYGSLFSNAEHHVTITRTLAKKWKGLTREELISLSGLSDGGRINRILNELSSSGFIDSYLPFQKKKKDKLYRLTDEYSLFYIKFIESSRAAPHYWLKLSQSQKWKSWAGYAFESLCIKHVEQIKKSLGISTIYTETGSFIVKGKGTQKGAQIDLLIDRNDDVINLCEMKFYEGPFTISKSYAQKLREKITAFKEKTSTRKQIFITMVTSFGISENKHSLGLIHHDITFNDLFE